MTDTVYRDFDLLEKAGLVVLALQVAIFAALAVTNGFDSASNGYPIFVVSTALFVAGQRRRLVDADRAAWNARAQALQQRALDVLAAVDARNAEQLWDLGGELDVACENCHRQYWYPNEKVPAY